MTLPVKGIYDPSKNHPAFFLGNGEIEGYENSQIHPAAIKKVVSQVKYI